MAVTSTAAGATWEGARGERLTLERRADGRYAVRIDPPPTRGRDIRGQERVVPGHPSLEVVLTAGELGFLFGASLPPGD